MYDYNNKGNLGNTGFPPPRNPRENDTNKTLPSNFSEKKLLTKQDEITMMSYILKEENIFMLNAKQLAQLKSEITDQKKRRNQDERRK